MESVWQQLSMRVQENETRYQEKRLDHVNRVHAWVDKDTGRWKYKAKHE